MSSRLSDPVDFMSLVLVFITLQSANDLEFLMASYYIKQVMCRTQE